MKCSCQFLFALSLCFGPVSLPAWGQGKSDSQVEFLAQVCQDAGGAKLPYRLLRPSHYDPAKGPYPLVLFLHGAGERGDNNQAQLVWGKKWMQNAAEEFQSFVLAPQCPNNKRWVEVDWSADAHKMPAEPSEPMRLTLELIAKLQKEYPLDARRLYVMGLSMGGYGTWDLIQRRPGMFAAAVPICGGGDETGAAVIARTQVWAFHGAKDGVVKPQRSRNLVKAALAAGGKARYTEYPNVGHNAWSGAFADPEMPKWLFAQKRP